MGSQELGLTLVESDVRGMDKDMAVNYLTSEAERQADRLLYEQIEENLPKQQPESEWNWGAMASWMNRLYGQNLNPRELRSLAKPEEGFDLDGLQRNLFDRAVEHIGKTDFAPLDLFLHEDFGRNQLSGWLHKQYGLVIPPSSFGVYDEPEKSINFIMEKVRERYDEQDARFPVIISLMRFQGTAEVPGDRDGLIRWANNRFRCNIDPVATASLSIEALAGEILNASRAWLPKEEVSSKVNGFLERAFPRIKGKPGPAQGCGRTDAAAGVRAAAVRCDPRPGAAQEASRRGDQDSGHEGLRNEVPTRDGSGRTPGPARAARFRWKEHLYHMDFLRQNVGLVGYAQKDPKVEYKRQGMKAFEAMWDRIGEEVTSAVFRLEREADGQFLSNVWHETAAIHESAAPIAQEVAQPVDEPATQTNQPQAAVEPIRNTERKIGRNDPCPCGSGKKFKNCHGAT